MVYSAVQIERAVASICPDIQRRVEEKRPRRTEREYWWELSACVLSSQVPYALAIAAADRIDQSGLLHVPVPGEVLELELCRVLSAPLELKGRLRRYRFPGARSAQLARTHKRVFDEAHNLSSLLSGFTSAAEARQWLVARAPGLGPKQASMFLRNAGISYNLAILDRHVLDYMAAIGLRSLGEGAVGSFARYRLAEATLRRHAEASSWSVGIMDWAIWIVMRMVKQRGVQPV